MSAFHALAVTGPTTSGKTALSIPLAQRLRGEIVSMDSRQVYRGMDVGTDKVGDADRAKVPHHGLDLVDPNQRYSAAEWARSARTWIRQIRARGHVPLLVGGTGFYLKALTEPVFREPDRDPDRRRRLEEWLADRPRKELERWVETLDPERATLAREGGPQRLIRSLEVALLTGHSLSWWHQNAPPEGPAIPVAVVVLSLPRERLDRQIEARAHRMFETGILEEVRELLNAGYTAQDPGMTGTGYREAAAVLAGELTVEEAADRMQRATRQYARRQLTWFRNQLPDEGVLEVDATQPVQDQVEEVMRWWERIGSTEGGVGEGRN